MTLSRRPSWQTIGVLRALSERPQQWRYGYELGQEVGLKSGSLYPILMRLSDRGCLEARWENDAPPGRPPRHLYRLTANGAAMATDWAPKEAPAAGERSPRADIGLRGAW
jgi:DNA-binding PadR family transcriptional regulator